MRNIFSCNIQETYAGEKLVFKVETDRGIFNMCNRNDFSSDDSTIVWVDTIKFLNLWKNDRAGRHKDISHGDRNSWLNDYKMHHAEAGFTGSKKDSKNPVPLAWVCCSKQIEMEPECKKFLFLFKRVIGYKEKESFYFSFVDGITRTIWLMAYGCKIFPVQCRNDDASLLYEIAGSKQILPISISESLAKCS